MPDTADLIAKVLGASPVDDAVLDAIALSACADGIANVEVVAIVKIARELPSLAGASPEDIDTRVRAAFERLKADGLEGRLQALGTMGLDADARRRVFAAAAVVQYADGLVTSSENEFLLDLADVLGLDDAKVSAILEDIERALEIEPGGLAGG